MPNKKNEEISQRDIILQELDDKRRIVITDMQTGKVVYDNGKQKDNEKPISQ